MNNYKLAYLLCKNITIRCFEGDVVGVEYIVVRR